jgi:hypothetical protein
MLCAATSHSLKLHGANIVVDLLSTSENELYAAIGEYVAYKSVTARPPSKAQIIADGKAWVVKFHADFRKALCESKLIKYAQAHPGDTVALSVSIGTVLARLTGIDAETERGGDKALMALATLIVKEGIDNYCGPATGKGAESH